MPTPSEQKALAFVAIVVLLAGAARVVRAGALGPSAPTASDQQALARQTFAANSSAANQRQAKAARNQKSLKLSRRRRDDVVKDVAGVASVPFSDVRPGIPSSTSDPGGPPPPWPRIDVGGPAGLPNAPRPGGQSISVTPPSPIDLDIATAAQIEGLPRIGPALARRILANRDSLGPFRSLDGLRRVKGMGPATLRLLAPLVTFSGQTRR